MPKQRSEKEFIFNLYLKKYPEVLEGILGVDLAQIELEIPYGRKKIDFYAVSRDKRVEVFVENQLTQSDVAHLKEKIMPILQSLQEGIVVWTAQRFDTAHLSAVKAFLKANPQKYVNVYGVELHPEVIKQLKMIQFFSPYLQGSIGEFPDDFPGEAYEKKRIQGPQGQVVEQIMEIDKDWWRSSMIDPRMAEILLEEVTDERAFLAQQERISEYLIHRF
ncbi:hypothetical protein L1765_07920 [Microaerobacter geothermalis]|uniref:hypothetical protein n=1 Tax=Microaerobacter geothermalis TaxID=674972 RepID=UPI001F19C7B3|nr:hypothetical protein [Microaerobacter geothermalis]MCF6093896.1 hypothetical protein [Microaerobacter geothermalis]